ncbi:hypothetical protein QAD02_021802 [Eretmocerus hayati]|uniref:Uncharacterized protein n=1 Tax=Eretmocerus hayati TaxID=131215 RepID=A0ACC2PRR0_9HYME|nr:hypothetical protein QAD02_021802 [Eretmocerus hayati]
MTVSYDCQSRLLSVVHFHAPWAEQCKQINDLLTELSRVDDFRDVQFASLSAEKFPGISIESNISAVPTILLFRNGNFVSRIDGADLKTIRNHLEKHHSRCEPKMQTPNVEADTLIRKFSCVLFVEGSSDRIQCKTAETVINILNRHGTDFELVDVSVHSEVRDSIEKHSGCQIYPQLYIDGTFVGGSDIVQKLSDSGKLDEILVEKSPALESRLKRLVNRSVCMLFMKGDRRNPRCGFSKKMIALLDHHHADYETYNILEDNEVREGLKNFSNWPTYPQLYLKGELIGGLDIITELSVSGELENILPKIET